MISSGCEALLLLDKGWDEALIIEFSIILFEFVCHVYESCDFDYRKKMVTFIS